VQLKPDYKEAKISATANFWGNLSTVDISKMVNDRNDSLLYVNTIDVSGPLSQSALGTPANSILQAENALVEKAVADKADAEKIAAQKTVKPKLMTISCTNGKVTKKVTAANPKCPAGYKKK
jgi:hypothetical protein